MGNNNVYGEGHFISANKIEKPHLKLDERRINIENVFGRLDIPTTRAQRADDTIMEDLKISFLTKVEHFEHSEQVIEQIETKIVRHKHHQKSALEDKGNIQESHFVEDRKIKTEPSQSVMNSNFSEYEKYMSRQDSPVKQENKWPEESHIQIF